MMHKAFLVIFIWVMLPFSFVVAQQAPEFRGAWVATAVNIDWPTQSGLKKQQLKEEFIGILDTLVAHNFNAVIVQIRPASDAFYQKGRKEPWSEWLSPESKNIWWDPLAFMIEEAHDRGLEFHGWLNPYRAIFDSHDTTLHKKHIYHQHPEWFLKYGKGELLNPGIPEVRMYITGIIRDLVRNYDMEAIHLDDYFYPYPKKGCSLEDLETFRTYHGRFSEIHSWRRNNVDLLIQNIQTNIKAVDPRVKFGVSPFGVWRNSSVDSLGSDTYAGIPSYDSVYADTRKWLKEEWVDYLAPQVYWAFGFKPAAYEVLVPWWNDNAAGKHIYIGHAAYKVANNYDSTWYEEDQLAKQVAFNRMYPNIKGSSFFSMKILKNDQGGCMSLLVDSVYQQKSLVPPMSFLDSIPPNPPRRLKVLANKKSKEVKLRWKKPIKASDAEIAYRYAIWIKTTDSFKNDEWVLYKVISAKSSAVTIEDIGVDILDISITALDKVWNQSPRAKKE